MNSKLRKRGPAGSKDTQEDLDAVEMSTSGEQVRFIIDAG